MKHLKDKKLLYAGIFSFIGLLGALFLQAIWISNTFNIIHRSIQDEGYKIIQEALMEEGQIRFSSTPEGTEIMSGSINDTIPRMTYFYEKLSDIGYPISLNNLDSIVSELLLEKGLGSKYCIYIFNPKSGEIFSKIGTQKDPSLLSIRPRYFPIRSDYTQVVQLIITSPFHVFITRMGELILATAIILVFIIGCIIYQVKIISQLNKIFKIREDFSYALIHDMKTPLSTIFMTLNFLHTGRLDDKPEKKEKYFQIAESEADHLLTLTNKVLTISKLEQHKLEMHKEELELEPIIDKLIDKFTAKAEKPVYFIKDLQAEAIYADEEFFEEVLSNLIDNAIKYSKESVEITLSSTSNELYTILKVHDNGFGISDEDQKVIFNKYERAAAGRRTRKKGSSGFGLGLNFVQQVVEAHGGKIIVNSIEGEFTEFVIYLPQIIQKL